MTECEEDYRQDHPLVVAHRLLTIAQRKSAHPKVVSKIENRINTLSASVVSSWRETEDFFPILDALHGKEAPDLKNEP
jgi:hypothetical protein